MSRLITRRTLVTAGLTTAAAASGLGAAIHYGLIPPDYGGITGIGETLTYSAQRLLTSGYSLAREFSTSGEAQHLEAARLGWAGGDGRKCRGNHSGARIGRDADQPS